MKANTKTVSYSSKNTYATLNTLNSQTKNVWVVFHGIGYLSRYFLKYFNGLNPVENYIIAPQAPSKYYLDNTYRHVGASWLTKEDTAQEIENLMDYIDAVLKIESVPNNCNLIAFGFSQGVSIATRWVAKRKIQCRKLILYAGSLPKELHSDGFEHLRSHNSKVMIVLGTKDPYITSDKLVEEKNKAMQLFKGFESYISFKGGHEVRKDIINSLV